MKLRNRSVGFGQTFFPLKRLPIELQNMIWRLTAQPRVVEIEYKETWKEDLDKLHPPEYWEREGAYEEYEHYSDRVRFGSYTPLPVACYVCHNARNAVLPLYPLCFASEAHGPGVQFNLSVDTLYIGPSFQKVLFEFIESLTSVETAQFKNLALDCMLGYNMYGDGGTGLWQKLGAAIDDIIPGLKNIMTAWDVGRTLTSISRNVRQPDKPRVKLIEDAASVCSDDKKGRCMEIFEKFPQELIERFQFTGMELLMTKSFIRAVKLDWSEKRTKMVWVWRRSAYPWFNITLPAEEDQKSDVTLWLSS